MDSLWLDSIFSNNNFFKLDKNINSDVCIIGAGIFGITCGYYLSKLGYNVVILEKDTIGSKTTGHTTRKNYKSSWFVLFLFDRFLWEGLCKRLFVCK